MPRNTGSFARSCSPWVCSPAPPLAALVFVAVVLALPNLGRPIAVEQFLWAYFGMLILTSVGGLGLERGAGLAVANGEGDAQAPARRSW